MVRRQKNCLQSQIHYLFVPWYRTRQTQIQFTIYANYNELLFVSDYAGVLLKVYFIFDRIKKAKQNYLITLFAKQQIIIYNYYQLLSTSYKM